MELALAADVSIDIAHGRGIAERLYRAVRDAIRDGQLRAGERVPSTRELGVALCVSRNTVSDVYERLGREGYLDGRHGSGTFVAMHAPESRRDTRATAAAPRRVSGWAGRLPRSRSIVPAREIVHDFRPGLPDLDAFPIAIWRRLAARNLRELSNDVGAYGDAAGQPRLRFGIARYLAHSRAVRCDGEDVFICNGSQQALDLLGRILVDRGTEVAIENPGYTPAASIFRAAGAKITPVPVDAEGLIVGKLPPRAKIVYVTPSHQFPLGVTLSLTRRRALLAWAKRSGGVIIEDDYDSEFRFAGRPMESLQGLDRDGTVVYLGTFSKVLFPGLRLGYVVAPPWLQEPFIAAKWLTDRHASSLEQSVMADFLAEGHFGRHLRRMQRTYSERRGALVEALARCACGYLSIFPSYAGLHVAASLPRGFDVDDLVQRAYEAGVGLYAIGPFYLQRPSPGLMFGYGACPVAEIDEGVRRLGGILRSMPLHEETKGHRFRQSAKPIA